MNEIEFIPTDDGMVAVVSKPDGEVTMELMSLEQFDRLAEALDAR